jgi:hypothetical protein
MLDSADDKKRRHSESNRRWRAANLEKTNEAMRDWRAANREEWNDYQRDYRAANREKVNAARREHRAANREKVNAARRDRYHVKKAEKDEAARIEAERIATEQRAASLEARQRAADEHMEREVAAMKERRSKKRRYKPNEAPESEAIIYGRRWWPRPLNAYIKYDWELLRGAHAFFDDCKRFLVMSRAEPNRKEQAIQIRGLLRTMRLVKDEGPKIRAFWMIATQITNDYGGSDETNDIDNRPPPTTGVCNDD